MPSPEATALARIRQAAASGAAQLDLSGLGLGLTVLPPEIGALTALQTLDLGWNQLIALPPEIGALTALQTLDLGWNQLIALPPEIGALTALQALKLSFNRITALPLEIGALTALQALKLSFNRITALPLEIGALTALPPEIGALTALQTLNLWKNQLTALPPEISGLTALQTLDLEYNQLTALPPEIGGLTALQTLALRWNQLTALPPEMANLSRLRRLNLHGNPLALALPRALLGDELFGSGDAQAILRFYRAVWEDGQALGEARLLFVGQPAAGKTSLAYRLLDGSYQENRPSTLTVETHRLPLGGYTAHLWDFGGQDFMHATHPLFFSARCVYLLVLNVRQTYEQNRVEYWLRTIRAFGGDSPIIIVGNHADAGQHVLDLPHNRLKNDFPSIFGFLQTSAKEARGLDELRDLLTQAVESLPHARVRFAQPHLRVKAALEEEKSRRPIIPYERCRELCAGEGITDEQDQDTLLALLHELGVVLDFREAGEPLSPDGVLDPNWVTNAIYRLLTDPQARRASAGRLTPDEIGRILQDYKPYHRDLILKLMQRFELAYPAAGDWYLPNLMPQDEPADASDSAWAGALIFAYAYPELPESVITRFIVRTHEWRERVWRWGQFCSGTTTAPWCAPASRRKRSRFASAVPRTPAASCWPSCALTLTSSTAPSPRAPGGRTSPFRPLSIRQTIPAWN